MGNIRSLFAGGDDGSAGARSKKGYDSACSGIFMEVRGEEITSGNELDAMREGYKVDICFPSAQLTEFFNTGMITARCVTEASLLASIMQQASSVGPSTSLPKNLHNDVPECLE